MNLPRSVIATLAYSDYFSYPLTLPELHNRLIKYPVSLSELEKGVKRLLDQKKIQKKGKYFCLPGRTAMVERRERHADLSGSQRRYAKRISYRLSHISGVLAIYLTGSLAMMNTDGKDDIDFLVVTRAGHLWLSRLYLTLYCSLLGIRRTPQAKNTAGKICLNLYLSPRAFTIPVAKRSLYTAYELIQTIPLYDPDETHAALLAANPWIHEFLPNFLFPKPKHSFNIIHQPSAIGRLTERLAYYLQLAYMRNKMTKEYITPDSAFFHPRNPGKSVLKKIAL